MAIVTREGARVREWREASLGDLLTLQRGFDITKKAQVPGPVPVVSSSGIASFHDEARAEGPGVVIGRKGSLGTVFFVDRPYWPHDTTLWVKDFKGHDPFFCYLLLQTLPLASLDAGSSNPTLNRNHAHTLPVRIPPLCTQQRIAAFVAGFDDLIQINERRIELLEWLARSLYREWFVRFRFPGASASQVPSGIPKGWKTVALGELCEIVRGRSYRSSQLSETDGVLFLNLKCVGRGGGFRPEGIKRYTGPFKEAQVLTAGDVLVAVTDMTQERRIVAQAFRVPDLGETPAIPSLDLVVLRPHVESLRLYLYTYLRYSGFGDRVRHFANGANVLHLAADRILAEHIVVPDGRTLRQFIGHTEMLLDESEFLAHANRQLAATRDLLLPRLVTGRLDISDIDLRDLLSGEPV